MYRWGQNGGAIAGANGGPWSRGVAADQLRPELTASVAFSEGRINSILFSRDRQSIFGRRCNAEQEDECGVSVALILHLFTGYTTTRAGGVIGNYSTRRMRTPFCWIISTGRHRLHTWLCRPCRAPPGSPVSIKRFPCHLGAMAARSLYLRGTTGTNSNSSQGTIELWVNPQSYNVPIFAMQWDNTYPATRGGVHPRHEH